MNGWKMYLGIDLDDDKSFSIIDTNVLQIYILKQQNNKTQEFQKLLAISTSPAMLMWKKKNYCWKICDLGDFLLKNYT